jgi:hypothetical protein
VITMNYQIKMIPVFLLAFFVTGCFLNNKDEKLKNFAKALSKAADECLYDVRDSGFKYDKSPNCTSLGALSELYIEAGGWQNVNSLSEHARIANEALTTAWKARAVSASGDPSIRIW